MTTMMAISKVKRIRRKVGKSSRRQRPTDNALLELLSLPPRLLMGGVVLLAIMSTTGTVDAFQFQHPLSTSSSSRNQKKLHQHCNYHENNLQQLQLRLPLIRLGTSLSAEATSGNNDGGIGNSWSSSSESSAASVDAGIAAIDQKYGNNSNDDSISLHLEDDDDEDEDFYKDFENFDYTPFLEKDDSASSAAAAETSSSPSSSTTVAAEGKDTTSSTGSTSVAERVDTVSHEDEQQQQQQQQVRPAVAEQPVHMRPLSGFNVVLTHCTADFDSLASAVGLAKLWSTKTPRNDEDDDTDEDDDDDEDDYDSSTDNFPTFVVLPRGAHPAVQRFLALHKHLFPIRSLKSLPDDLSKLHRLALVDAQRKDRIGPAEVLLQHADRVTVVDHHVDMESDIPDITDYVVDGVGSVSTLIVERLMRQQRKQLRKQLKSSSSPITTLTEAEATLLALGIHADTGSLCFDSTTPRDASALAWVMAQGASQVAIAEHAQSSLSPEQQKVLTQALVNTNSTVAHGVTVSTVLLTADGFINGLAAVTQDAMELSSADVFLLGVVYEPKSGRGGKSKKAREPGKRVKSKLLTGTDTKKVVAATSSALTLATEEQKLAQERLKSSFDQKDLDGNGLIDRKELADALVASGIVATEDTILGLMESIDTNKDNVIDFDEFIAFADGVQASAMKDNAESDNNQEEQKSLPPSASSKSTPSLSSTLIIIGRAKPGVNMKSVKLGKLLEKYGGGGHPKAASATVRLNDEFEAAGIMSDLVDELIETSLQEQSTVGDFMTSPVLSVKSDMSENQVEDFFTRYDVRALPVVNEENEVIGLVSYKEVAAAKQRMWNKEQKRLRQELKQKEKNQQQGNNGDADDDADADNDADDDDDTLSEKGKEQRRQQRKIAEERRRRGPTVKAWMKQHIKTVEASLTMAEVEAILLENDVGCIPVVQDGTKKLVGMVTRTDLLRQHRYYPSLHYNNKGMSDSIASRKHIIALRKKLKQFDLDE